MASKKRKNNKFQKKCLLIFAFTFCFYILGTLCLNSIESAINIEVQRVEDAELEAKWDKILAVKADVTKALEIARADKTIGHSLNALVTVYADSEMKAFLDSIAEDLVAYFIVSAVKICDENEAPDNTHAGETGIKVSVSNAPGEKCERCWMYSETVGTISEHPTLCKRCADVVSE